MTPVSEGPEIARVTSGGLGHDWLTYVGVLAVSGWGGVVSWIQRRRSGEARPFSFVELIGEIATASFCGLIAFWLCQEAQISKYATAAITGVAGHLGSRGLFLLERALLRRYLPPELVAELRDSRGTGDGA